MAAGDVNLGSRFGLDWIVYIEGEALGMDEIPGCREQCEMRGGPRTKPLKFADTE